MRGAALLTTVAGASLVLALPMGTAGARDGTRSCGTVAGVPVHAVAILLKAADLGRCEGRRAYLKLCVCEPRRPGGPLGPWLSWSGSKTLCESY